MLHFTAGYDAYVVAAVTLSFLLFVFETKLKVLSERATPLNNIHI